MTEASRVRIIAYIAVVTLITLLSFGDKHLMDNQLEVRTRINVQYANCLKSNQWVYCHFTRGGR